MIAEQPPLVSVREIRGGCFRANRAYHLLPFDQLTPAESLVLAPLIGQTECYGLLRPNCPGFTVKSISHDVAVLFSALAEAGPIPPNYLFEKLSNADIARLILDGILEIYSGDGFVTGPQAQELVLATTACTTSSDILGSLSLKALNYAENLQPMPHRQLSIWLYCYNRLPASPKWRRLLPTKDSIKSFLMLDTGSPSRVLLDRDWLHLEPSSDNPDWIIWCPRNFKNSSGVNYKMYISPACNHLPEALRITIKELSRFDIRCLKVGGTLHGILRPDKLVAYFSQFKTLLAAADTLSTALRDCPAHGVPFTAGLDELGLLSWGIDPPKREYPLPWLGPSWRYSITDRLACALELAWAFEQDNLSSTEFALNRLALEGVNICTWEPHHYQ